MALPRPREAPVTAAAAAPMFTTAVALVAEFTVTTRRLAALPSNDPRSVLVHVVHDGSVVRIPRRDAYGVQRSMGAAHHSASCSCSSSLPAPASRRPRGGALARLRKWRWHGTGAARLRCQRRQRCCEAAFRSAPRASRFSADRRAATSRTHSRGPARAARRSRPWPPDSRHRYYGASAPDKQDRADLNFC